jgi:GGDEF domain-containing protein
MQLNRLSEPFYIPSRRRAAYCISSTLGVAALPDHGTTALELLAAADGALLKAKEQGRDRVLTAEVAVNRFDTLP